MVWLGNPDDKLSDSDRAPLLAEREKLVDEVKRLKASPPPSGSPAFKLKFYQEDLTNLARKILKIDEKLGRKK